MYLTDNERKMLSGDEGPVVAEAMDYLIQFGEAFDATKLVDISFAVYPSEMAIYEGAVEELTQYAQKGGKVRVSTPTTTLACDLEKPCITGCPEELVKIQTRVEAAHRQMGLLETYTCTPQNLGFVPPFGSFAALTESSAIIYYNSVLGMAGIQGFNPKLPPVAQMFGGAGVEYQKKYGTKDEVFAQVQVKARQHARHNPKALFSDPLTVEEIMESPQLFGPLTRLQCCPPTCGAAAAVVCSEDYAKKQGLSDPVKILAQHLETDREDSFANSMLNVIGYGMSQRAASNVYEVSGFGPEDMDVIELHDCFTVNELISYEALGLTAEGTAEQFITDGDNTYGGKFVVNPSGGLLSKGHPLGATGLAQCYELVNQLRGTADKRQVEGAKLALQHNIGIGGAAVVTMYGK